VFPDRTRTRYHRQGVFVAGVVVLMWQRAQVLESNVAEGKPCMRVGDITLLCPHTSRKGGGPDLGGAEPLVLKSRPGLECPGGSDGGKSVDVHVHNPFSRALWDVPA